MFIFFTKNIVELEKKVPTCKIKIERRHRNFKDGGRRGGGSAAPKMNFHERKFQIGRPGKKFIISETNGRILIFFFLNRGSFRFYEELRCSFLVKVNCLNIIFLQ